MLTLYRLTVDSWHCQRALFVENLGQIFWQIFRKAQHFKFWFLLPEIVGRLAPRSAAFWRRIGSNFRKLFFVSCCNSRNNGRDRSESFFDISSTSVHLRLTPGRFFPVKVFGLSDERLGNLQRLSRNWPPKCKNKKALWPRTMNFFA